MCGFSNHIDIIEINEELGTDDTRFTLDNYKESSYISFEEVYVSECRWCDGRGHMECSEDCDFCGEHSEDDICEDCEGEGKEEEIIRYMKLVRVSGHAPICARSKMAKYSLHPVGYSRFWQVENLDEDIDVSEFATRHGDEITELDVHNMSGLIKFLVKLALEDYFFF